MGGLVAAAAVAGVVISALQRQPAVDLELPVARALPPAFPIEPAAPGPVSAFGFSVTDDPAIHRVMLFGGVDSDAQTWLWDGVRWTEAHPPVSPPGRFHAAAAFDPRTGLVLLFGGRLESGRIVADTWAWTGTTWRELNNGADGPPPGESSLMAWDGATGSMILVTPTGTATGGETWTWTGAGWVRQPGADLPATPVAAQMAYDPVTSSVLLVSPLLPPLGPGVSTWRYDGGGWQRLPGAPPSVTTGLALDPASGHLVVCSDPTPDARSLLWDWGGAGWTQVPRSELPVDLGVEVSDIDRREVLMLGFAAGPTQQAPQPVLVWSWSGHAWRQLGTNAAR